MAETKEEYWVLFGDSEYEGPYTSEEEALLVIRKYAENDEVVEDDVTIIVKTFKNIKVVTKIELIES